MLRHAFVTIWRSAERLMVQRQRTDVLVDKMLTLEAALWEDPLCQALIRPVRLSVNNHIQISKPQINQ